MSNEREPRAEAPADPLWAADVAEVLARIPADATPEQLRQWVAEANGEQRFRVAVAARATLQADHLAGVELRQFLELPCAALEPA